MCRNRSCNALRSFVVFAEEFPRQKSTQEFSLHEEEAGKEGWEEILMAKEPERHWLWTEMLRKS